MVYLTDVREWVKTLALPFQGYWIGRLSTKKENTLGIYPLGNAHNYLDYFADSSRSYDVTGVNFLIHGNNNKDETERLAWAFFDALEANRSAFMMNHKQVYFIRLLFDAPMDVGSDGEQGGIYEYTMQIEIFSERI